MRGPKPKPVELRALQGNPAKREIPKTATFDSCPDGPPLAPEFLGDSARQEWDKIAGQLHANGLLTIPDESLLAAYCAAFGRWRDAETALKTAVLVGKGRAGTLKRNPWLMVSHQAMDELLRIACEFGMTPSARARIGLAVQKKSKKSPLASIQNRTNARRPNSA